MSLFQFSNDELLGFFAVLVRMSTLIAVLPFTGNNFIPAPAKILLSLAITLTVYPAITGSGLIRVSDVAAWSSEAGRLILTVGQEALVGLVLGFTAKLIFDAILFGANMTGNYMGFAAASMYDPHQESQSQVVSEFQMALAMLLFLAVDAHHLMLRAAIDSYRLVGIGQASLGAALAQRFIEFTSQVIRVGFQLSAPIAIVLFTVNLAFGVVSKALPQLNVLILSLGVGAMVGLTVFLLGLPEMQAAAREMFFRIGDWMNGSLVALKGT